MKDDPDYVKLLRRGRELFGRIGDELNVISREHIRTNPEMFRREEDHDELCVALALLEQRIETRDMENKQ